MCLGCEVYINNGSYEKAEQIDYDSKNYGE